MLLLGLNAGSGPAHNSVSSTSLMSAALLDSLFNIMTRSFAASYIPHNISQSSVLEASLYSALVQHFPSQPMISGYMVRTIA